jgi:hypothetical protein
MVPFGLCTAGRRIVIVWQDATVPYNEGGTAIRARLFGSDTIPLEPADLVVASAGHPELNVPVVTALPNGSFVVAWSNAFSRVDGAIVSTDDSSTPLQLEGTEPGNLSALSGEKFIIASTHNRTGIIAQIFNSDGSTFISDLGLNQPGGSAKVAKLTNGGFVLVWGNAVGIAGQVFDSVGNKVGQQFTIVSTDPLYTDNGPAAVAALPGRLCGRLEQCTRKWLVQSHARPAVRFNGRACGRPVYDSGWRIGL